MDLDESYLIFFTISDVTKRKKKDRKHHTGTLCPIPLLPPHLDFWYLLFGLAKRRSERMVFLISPSDLDQEMQRGISNLKSLVFQAFNQVKGNLLFHLCKTQISQHLAHPRYELFEGAPAFKCLGSQLPVMIFVFLLFFFF